MHKLILTLKICPPAAQKSRITVASKFCGPIGAKHHDLRFRLRSPPIPMCVCQEVRKIIYNYLATRQHSACKITYFCTNFMFCNSLQRSLAICYRGDQEGVQQRLFADQKTLFVEQTCLEYILLLLNNYTMMQISCAGLVVNVVSPVAGSAQQWVYCVGWTASDMSVICDK